MANRNSNSEPSSAPTSGIWYNLTLGSSYKENPSTKFCTLRYEFKPASIDKSQAGSLHKNKENRVSLEFQNNQHGKPKVVFEGSSEDYKKNDGVLFFNGDSFRLERLHRSVKRLRHVRMPGESAAASSSLNPATNSPPLGKMPKTSHSSSKAFVPAVPVLIEKIDIGEPDSPGAKPTARTTENPSSFPSKVTSSSPGKRKNTEQEDHYSLIFGDDDNEEEIPDKKDAEGQGPDMNIIPNHDSDDEIADVDVSDDVEGNGLNAAEALRAQVNAEEHQQTSSSSGSGSSSSGSDSGSGSGSGSSSSGSEASDDDSASSGGDVDI